VKHRKYPCNAHERRLRRIERYGKIAIGMAIVLMFRKDNPENLKWIFDAIKFFAQLLIPEANAVGR